MPDPNPSDDPVVAAMTSLADHFDGLQARDGNGVNVDIAGSIRATLTAATTASRGWDAAWHAVNRTIEGTKTELESLRRTVPAAPAHATGGISPHPQETAYRPTWALAGTCSAGHLMIRFDDQVYAEHVVPVAAALAVQQAILACELRALQDEEACRG